MNRSAAAPAGELKSLSRRAGSEVAVPLEPIALQCRVIGHTQCSKRLFLPIMPTIFQPVPFKPILAALGTLASLALLAACSSTPQPKLQQELFSSGASPFSRNFSASGTDACEASRRALLNQGYLTTASRPDTIDATRDFQPTGDMHVTIEFHVTCTAGEDADNSSIVYANAVQSGYALKKSDTSASVGLSVFGSLSVPIRSNSDAMVKVSSETIQSAKFYEGFFEIVDRNLRTVVKSAPVPATTITTGTLPPAPLAIPGTSASIPPATVPAALASPLSTPFIEAAKSGDASRPASQPAALPGPALTPAATK
jgi:hypothetical protein